MRKILRFIFKKSILKHASLKYVVEDRASRGIETYLTSYQEFIFSLINEEDYSWK